MPRIIDKYGNLKTIAATGPVVESDPIWLADKPSYLTSALAASTYALASHTHTFASLTSKPTTLSGYGITDATPASRTLTINGVTYDLSANRSWTVSAVETDPVFLASEAATILSSDTSNWNTAYGWGNHASAGYLTSAAIGTTVQAYDADLTTWAGITPAANVGTFLATPSSANLAAAVTDETGSGALVFATSPTLVTPNIGVANGTSLVLGGTIDTSSIFDAQSTSKGLLIPRMTTAQINAITSPAQGLMAYSTDENFLYYYDSIWGWVSDNLFYKKKYEDEALASFLSAGTAQGGGLIYTSTTGGTVVWIQGFRNGVSRLSTSTSATGRSSWISDASNANAFAASVGRVYFETSVNIATLSTVSEAYSLAIGFSQNTTVPTLTNGAHFLYDLHGAATGSASSANWQVGNAIGSSRSYTTTGTTVAINTYYKLGIMITNGTQVDYYINDTLVKSETTNVPATLGGIYILLLKSNGTTARTVDIDYVYFRVKYNTPRP